MHSCAHCLPAAPRPWRPYLETYVARFSKDTPYDELLEKVGSLVCLLHALWGLMARRRSSAAVRRSKQRVPGLWSHSAYVRAPCAAAHPLDALAPPAPRRLPAAATAQVDAVYDRRALVFSNKWAGAGPGALRAAGWCLSFASRVAPQMESFQVTACRPAPPSSLHYTAAASSPASGAPRTPSRSGATWCGGGRGRPACLLAVE